MDKDQSETLYDFRNRLPWIRRLRWNDQKLRQVPIHREQNFEDPFLALPLDDLQSHEDVRGLYVYQSEVSEEVWDALVSFVNFGGPSGYEQPGMFGRRKRDGGIPRPY